MSAYLITYDLSKPGQNYGVLYDRIKSISGTWAHVTESSWVVARTTQTAMAIRDELKVAIDANDKLFVGELTGVAAWWGLDERVSHWIKENL